MYSSSMDTDGVLQDKQFNSIFNKEYTKRSIFDQQDASGRQLERSLNEKGRKRPRHSSGATQVSTVDVQTSDQPSSHMEKHRKKNEHEHSPVSLDDLDYITTLGKGGFGQVDLVQLATDPTKTFALKKVNKQHVVKKKRQKYILSEKQIMMEAHSPFIARLYQTFKDDKYVYLMMEACLGGELLTVMEDNKDFDINMTRFVAGCVVEAFEYIHARGIVFNDLKPDNLVFDTRGYVKLVDFGLATNLGGNYRSWHCSGTTRYLSPEVILWEGSDRASDYWALGVVVFEMLTGWLPFDGETEKATYRLVMQGMDAVDFPTDLVSRDAKDMIRWLCRHVPAERLGYNSSIKSHPWFRNFDWKALKAQTMIPPFVPTVKSSTDHSNFDQFSPDTDIPEDEFSGWDADF